MIWVGGLLLERYSNFMKGIQPEAFYYGTILLNDWLLSAFFSFICSKSN